MKEALTEVQSHRGPPPGQAGSDGQDSVWKRNGATRPVGARAIVVTGAITLIRLPGAPPITKKGGRCVATSAALDIN